MDTCFIVLLTAASAQLVAGGYYNTFGGHVVPNPYLNSVNFGGYPAPAQPLFSYNVFASHPSTVHPAMPQVANTIYSSPSSELRGFSYQTQFYDGGRSEVVFVTGPDANELLKRSMGLFHSTAQSNIEASSMTPDVSPSEGDSDTSNTVTTPAPTSELSPVSSTTSSITTPSPYLMASLPVPSFSRQHFIYSNVSPYFAAPFGVHNLFSTYYQTVHQDPTKNRMSVTTPDLTKAAEEAQESMINEIGSAVPAPSGSVLISTKTEKSEVSNRILEPSPSTTNVESNNVNPGIDSSTASNTEASTPTEVGPTTNTVSSITPEVESPTVSTEASFETTASSLKESLTADEKATSPEIITTSEMPSAASDGSTMTPQEITTAA